MFDQLASFSFPKSCIRKGKLFFRFFVFFLFFFQFHGILEASCPRETEFSSILIFFHEKKNSHMNDDAEKVLFYAKKRLFCSFLLILYIPFNGYLFSLWNVKKCEFLYLQKCSYFKNNKNARCPKTAKNNIKNAKKSVFFFKKTLSFH